jgi:hypothetical protein
MVNALLIAIHARFVRDMSHLPEGVEVILCVGPEGATRDFDDFSTTEHLIAIGRSEASEIVRRYGLGTIPYPAPPLPVPAASDPTEGLAQPYGSDGPAQPDGSDQSEDSDGFDPLVDPTIRKPEPTAADTAAGTAAESTGQLEGAAPSVSAASGPVTQPEPGT